MVQRAVRSRSRKGSDDGRATRHAADPGHPPPEVGPGAQPPGRESEPRGRARHDHQRPHAGPGRRAGLAPGPGAVRRGRREPALRASWRSRASGSARRPTARGSTPSAVARASRSSCSTSSTWSGIPTATATRDSATCTAAGSGADALDAPGPPRRRQVLRRLRGPAAAPDRPDHGRGRGGGAVRRGPGPPTTHTPRRHTHSRCTTGSPDTHTPSPTSAGSPPPSCATSSRAASSCPAATSRPCSAPTRSSPSTTAPPSCRRGRRNLVTRRRSRPGCSSPNDGSSRGSATRPSSPSPRSTPASPSSSPS